MKSSTAFEFIITALLMGAFTVCIVVSSINLYNSFYGKQATTMPEGWVLLCDKKGNFTYQLPSGWIYEGTINRSARKARLDAWLHWDYLQRPHPPKRDVPYYEWHVCEDGQ